METAKLFINNEWVDGSSGKIIDVINPATEEVVYRVSRGNADDVDRAVNAARQAFNGWSGLDPSVRADYMRRLGHVMEDHADEFCDIITSEIGMPRSYVYDYHVAGGIRDAFLYADIAEHYKYEELAGQFPAYDGSLPADDDSLPADQAAHAYDQGNKIMRREPYGVVAGITPWNYPLMQATSKLFAAIAAGNTAVLKPSRNAPVTCLKLAECFMEAEFPDGVFNVVTGTGSEVGETLAMHPGIDALSFTGSTSAGIKVGRAALGTIKKITLELGGKSPMILLPGGDAEAAVRHICRDVFMNSGQTCCAYTRFIIPRDQEREIEDLLRKATAEFTVGDPLDRDTMVGPVISESAYEKVRNLIISGVEEGARLIAGRIPVPRIQKGFYIEPVIFMDVTSDMRIAREEIFGPVISVISYDTIEEAVRIANDTEYGLAGCVYGPEEEALGVLRQIRAGYLSLNGAYQGDDAPFGGYKMSGIGREGGIYGFEEFLEIKVIGI